MAFWNCKVQDPRLTEFQDSGKMNSGSGLRGLRASLAPSLSHTQSLAMAPYTQHPVSGGLQPQAVPRSRGALSTAHGRQAARCTSRGGHLDTWPFPT